MTETLGSAGGKSNPATAALQVVTGCCKSSAAKFAALEPKQKKIVLGVGGALAVILIVVTTWGVGAELVAAHGPPPSWAVAPGRFVTGPKALSYTDAAAYSSLQGAGPAPGLDPLEGGAAPGGLGLRRHGDRHKLARLAADVKVILTLPCMFIFHS